jgi:hypothetical protein
MQDIEVTFPGGKRVDAQVGPYVVRTDQPIEAGGAGSAIAPFDLFLASIATCAGIYVLGFCQARNLSVEGIRLEQQVELDPVTHLPRCSGRSETDPLRRPETDPPSGTSTYLCAASAGKPVASSG